MSELIETLRRSVKSRFDQESRVLSFDEFLAKVSQNPKDYLRSSVDWISDAFRYFDKNVDNGKSELPLFQEHYPDRFQPVVGQGEVQRRIKQVFEGFSKTGRCDKVLVLHGPNGSAKTTLCRNLFAALEKYSHTNEGAVYTFSWVFPLQKGAAKSMGIAIPARENSLESYAKWPTEDLGAILRSELHENPLFLIPKEERLKLINTWSSDKKSVDAEYIRSRFENSELSHKNTIIFETLLNEYQGDLSQVLRHIRVERFYFSYQLRNGLTVIEPQFGVDAHLRQVTLDQSLANLPPALHSLNLYQLEGDLIAGNRGVVEFNDLLKRPLESFKYLLSTSESSRVQLGPFSTQLDNVFIATTNDHQLEAFREHPEFTSFRGRFELIRVPYLLKYKDETQVYLRELEKLKEVKETLPHTASVLALWAVMSRYKKPITKNKSLAMSRVLETLSPLEKARAYNSGEVPDRLSDDERREFKQNLGELMAEHQREAFYEGMIGPSARELRLLLQNAALNPENRCLSPLSIIKELRIHVQRKSDFEYLRIESVSGYHDYNHLIDLAHSEWMRWVDEEIRSVLGMGQLPKIREILQGYVQKIMVLIRGEKIKNRMTGKSEDPSTAELELTEKLLGVSEGLEQFRQNLLGRLGAWSVENKKTLSEALPFEEIFPDLVLRIRNSLRAEEDVKLSKMSDVFSSQDIAALSARRDPDDQNLIEGERLAILAYRGLQKEKAYGPTGALEAIGEYLRFKFKPLSKA